MRLRAKAAAKRGSRSARALQPTRELAPGHYSDGHPLDEVHYLVSGTVFRCFEFSDFFRRANLNKPKI
jgi:hypothetical protein